MYINILFSHRIGAEQLKQQNWSAPSSQPQQQQNVNACNYVCISEYISARCSHVGIAICYFCRKSFSLVARARLSLRFVLVVQEVFVVWLGIIAINLLFLYIHTYIEGSSKRRCHRRPMQKQIPYAKDNTKSE